MALATERHVHVFAADQVCAVFAGRAEGETCGVVAQFAQRTQLLDLFALGNQLEDIVKRTPQKRSLQTRDNHHFAGVRGFFSKLHDVSEELSLVNADNVVVAPSGSQLGKQSHRD